MSLGQNIRNQIWVRFADQAKEPVKEWCDKNSTRNAFDEKVLGYPATKVLAAENGKVLVYLPVQQTIMLESVGLNPEASTVEQAAGLLECVKASATLAHGAGYREVYFLASDELTAKAAEHLLGFEEVPFRVLRKRI